MSSKIIMISAVYAILGIYTAGFNSTIDSVSKTATCQADASVAEQLANSGVGLAMTRLKNLNPTTNGTSAANISNLKSTMLGNSFTYSILPDNSLPSSQYDRKITSTSRVGSAQVIETVVVSYDLTNDVWRQSKIFVSTSYTK
jgi:hypothetical protein